MMSASTPACLLCGSGDISIRHSLSAGDILAGWSREGRQFPPRSIQSLLDERIIHLYECGTCGFQFFNPKLAGGEEFYEQLLPGSGYYAPDRPENQRNVRFAIEHGYQSLLDVGCGVG